MDDRESQEEELQRRLHEHMEAHEWGEAETVLRQLFDIADPQDSLLRWRRLFLLAGVLNCLSRPEEGTEMYRRALAEARRAGESHSAVGPARYMLANQYLLFGDPRDALAETDPIPAGVGHVQCLLHSIAAQALWKLGRRAEAEVAARQAMDACPTEERVADMTRDLAHILKAG